jgi:hypothetical protein
VTLSAAAVAELTWWVAHATTSFGQGMPIAHAHPIWVCDASGASDASASGWGGWIALGGEIVENAFINNLISAAPEGVRISEVVRAAQRGIEAAGSFTAEQAARSSSWRELFGVLMLLQALSPLIRHARLRLQLDSSVATGALGGAIPSSSKVMGGSMNEGLQELVISICDLCCECKTQLNVVWAPREQNKRADSISHAMEEDQYDYTLNANWVDWLENNWGPHDVDRFASGPHNCVVRSGVFNSRFGHPASGWQWSDSLTIDWNKQINFAHPPYMLVDLVLDHFVVCKARGTLIVPEWPSCSWWPRLFRGSKDPSVPTVQLERAPFVMGVVVLGKATKVLQYPSKSAEFAKEHLPKGMILAIRLDCSK